MLFRALRLVRYAFLMACAAYVVVAIYLKQEAVRAEMVEPPPQKAAPSPKAARELWWKSMRGFDLRRGIVSADLRTYEGARVKIPGFMVPLEDDSERVREFLLVPSMGACIHTPPPPPNQIVHVKMLRGNGVAMEWARPVWVEGIFRIRKSQGAYGEVAFFLSGESTELYERREE